MNDKKTKQYQLRLTPTMFKELKEQAVNEHTSVASIICKAIAEYLSKFKTK